MNQGQHAFFSFVTVIGVKGEKKPYPTNRFFCIIGKVLIIIIGGE